MFGVIPTPVSVVAHVLAYASLGFWLGPLPGTPLIWAVGGALVWASVIDLRQFEIPDLATLALTLLAVFWMWNDPRVPMVEHLLAGIFWPLAFQLVRQFFLWRRGFDGLGFGDVKLMVPLGLLCGLGGTTDLVLCAALAATLSIGALALVRKQNARILPLPFGPFLCASAWSIWIFSL